MTVRRAIALLAEQGILKSVQGKGVFVIDTFYQARISPEGLLFDGTFFQDPRLRQELLFLQKIPARKAMSELFRVKSDSLLWLLGRRWMAENMAVALEYSYFPAEWIPDFSQELCKIPWERLVCTASYASKPCGTDCAGNLCLRSGSTAAANSGRRRGFSGQSTVVGGKITVSCVILKFWRKPERLHII